MINHIPQEPQFWKELYGKAEAHIRTGGTIAAFMATTGFDQATVYGYWKKSGIVVDLSRLKREIRMKESAKTTLSGESSLPKNGFKKFIPAETNGHGAITITKGEIKISVPSNDETGLKTVLTVLGAA